MLMEDLLNRKQAAVASHEFYRAAGDHVLHPGSYTLSLRSRHGRRWTNRRVGITIA
jgi:hypothetical protein